MPLNPRRAHPCNLSLQTCAGVAYYPQSNLSLAFWLGDLSRPCGFSHHITYRPVSLTAFAVLSTSRNPTCDPQDGQLYKRLKALLARLQVVVSVRRRAALAQTGLLFRHSTRQESAHPSISNTDLPLRYFH